MTSPALWLAARELAARAPRVAFAAAVVAAVAATVTATELVARAREAAIAAQLDAIGPALTVVPAGTTPSALARYELEGRLPAGAEAEVRRALGASLRSVERRVVVRRELAGAPRVLVGLDGPSPSSGAAADLAVGSELGGALPPGTRVELGAGALTVGRVLPSTGSVEDLAVFAPAGTLRALGVAEGTSELRLFLAPGVSPRDAEARVAAAVGGAAVVRTDRGEVADGGVQDALARHRSAAYAVLAAVAGLTLLIASYLDATERRVELATLVAHGAARRTVLGGLLARSGAVALGGAAAGTIAGAALAAVLDASVAPVLPGALSLAASVVAAGGLVGIVAASPPAIASVARDPVRELQES